MTYSPNNNLDLGTCMLRGATHRAPFIFQTLKQLIA